MPTLTCICLLLALGTGAVSRNTGVRVSRTEADECAVEHKNRYENALRSAFADDVAKDFAADQVLADETADMEAKKHSLREKLSREVWRSVQRKNAKNAKDLACEHTRVDNADPCTTVRFDEKRQECVASTRITRECSKQRAKTGIRFL